MRIAVCRPKALFVRGGAEIFTDQLVAELQRRGHAAEIVELPFRTWPNEALLRSALLWRMPELGRLGAYDADGVDLVVATKFPSYLIRHPNKVVWLLHQFRQAHDLHDTELGQFSSSPLDEAIRARILLAERESLSDARTVFATSRNVARRLLDSTGIEASVLPHPPQELRYRCQSYDPFVLSVGRLDRAKRVDLLLEAAATDPAIQVVVVGDGPDRPRLEALGVRDGLDGRVSFLGRVDADGLADLYARCGAVYYAPVDEDFGMVPYEAFRARKPVVTTTDAGGPLDVVTDGATGRVAEPRPDAVAAALRDLLADPGRAEAYGAAGHEATAELGWESAIAELLSAASPSTPESEAPA